MTELNLPERRVRALERIVEELEKLNKPITEIIEESEECPHTTVRRETSCPDISNIATVKCVECGEEPRKLMMGHTLVDVHRTLLEAGYTQEPTDDIFVTYYTKKDD